MEKIAYGGWPNCIRLTDGNSELIVTTDVGPRVIRLGFVGGRNLMYEDKTALGKTGGDEFRLYGGHRFWHAPEADPRSYHPDNTPVRFSMRGDAVKLTAPVETTTGMQKTLAISLDKKQHRFKLVHRLTNKGLWPVDAAPWALSVMAQGGFAIFPQEDYRPHPDYLLPARPLVLWHYTNMADPRFTWGGKFIIFRQDPSAKTKNKIGLLNKQGWAAYALKGDLFVKTCPYDPAATYVDYGCNVESFTSSEMLEVETVGPLTRLDPGASVEHVEYWSLHKAAVRDNERSIEKTVLPLVSR